MEVIKKEYQMKLKFYQLVLLIALPLLTSTANAGLITNLALEGTATQSTTAHGGLASRAIDGNTNGNWNGGSITHTSNQQNAWWEVDLGQSSYIDEIVLWNRADCCSYRLNDFDIYLDDFLVASYSEDSAPTPSFTFSDLQLTGQVVRVQLFGSLNDRQRFNVQRTDDPSILSLAEVQVNGVKVPEPSTIAIFALGMIGLASRRFKKQS
jgi:hypothetical protein